MLYIDKEEKQVQGGLNQRDAPSRAIALRLVELFLHIIRLVPEKSRLGDIPSSSRLPRLLCVVELEACSFGPEFVSG